MNEPKNYAIVTDGIVVNVIWVCPEQSKEFGAIEIPNESIGIGIGWEYTDGIFIDPNPPIIDDLLGNEEFVEDEEVIENA